MPSEYQGMNSKSHTIRNSDRVLSRFCDQFGDRGVEVLKLTLRNIEDTGLPKPEAIGIDYPAYLNGLVKRSTN